MGTMSKRKDKFLLDDNRKVLVHLRLRVRIASVLLGATYLIVAIPALLGCQPISEFAAREI